MEKFNQKKPCPFSNAMREYMDNPEAKKMAQESGIKFETLFGVTCKD